MSLSRVCLKLCFIEDDTRKVVPETVAYNANADKLSVPQIQILEPPIVYKPTPKNVLDGSYSYSPEPVKKKPKLEYVPKARQHSHSKTPKYTPIATTPSHNLESDINDIDCPVIFDANDDFIKSESQSSESQAGGEEEPPTYIPTKILPEEANISKKTYDKENGKSLNDRHAKEKSSKSAEHNLDEKIIKSIDKISSQSKSHAPHHTKDNGRDNKKDKDSVRNKEKDKNTEREKNKQRDKDSDKNRSRKKERSSRIEESDGASNHKSTSSSSRSSKSTSSRSHAVLGSKSSSRRREKSSNIDASDISIINKKPSSSHSKTSPSAHRSTISTHSSSSSSKHRKNVEQSKSKEISRASIDSPTIPSPSSVFDTDSDEDDVMAQCRLIFEEFKSQPETNVVNI